MPAQGAFRAFPSSTCPRTWERRWRRWCSPGATRSIARWRDALPADAYVVAADSGLEHVHALGRRADLRRRRPRLGVARRRSSARSQRARVVEEHPADKDATDLELALAAAKRGRRDPRARSSARAAGGSTTSSPTRSCSRRPSGPAFELHALDRRRPRRRRARPRRAARRGRLDREPARRRRSGARHHAPTGCAGRSPTTSSRPARPAA